ncbi:DUF1206 domain-containing protein [Arthrobacter sp. TMN-49]
MRGILCSKDKTIKKELKDVADATQDASNSRAFIVAARTGFAISGLLHILVGVIAIQLAFGKSVQADQGGAMSQLSGQPAGALLLWISCAACMALALWQLSEVIFGYGSLESMPKLGKKLSAGGQGIVFLALAAAFATFALGTGKSSGKSTSDVSAEILKAPMGPLLLIAIGVSIAITGVVFAVRGVIQSFKKKLSLPASGPGKSTIIFLGVAGYIAKGIALFLVGLLFIVATVQARPAESTGLDGALRAVREQPFGFYLLALIGVGLISYGLYLVTKARFATM